ncbi:DNA-binding transcriptional MerR regulator [Hypnocyclicus thermotrophus]|uniref:DNA-binding transcriptional MerR regulator n=1 Tax=Hypnocyclicus thermotrophus TaxID=1627895 RepID=A0AA46E0A8_9FUSO|nr:MerR family transcriptional regulator [Hypnocyclicus thermotrophus]TDT72317.1 DNA-binding transcriptional MerR regulator [Hypnocyclicus thermotrophus]
MNYTIGEVAEKVNLTTFTLRYYEKEKILLPINRDESGKRVFKKKDIEWINLIKCFKETGMSMEDIKKLVELILEGDKTIPKRLEILKNHKEKVLKKMEDLEKNLNKIDMKIKWYNDQIKKT